MPNLRSLAGHVAIYGGSFNPPLIGHRLVCEYLLARGADAIWVAPVLEHADGKNLVTFHHRRQMCERMISGLGSRVEVTDAEVRANGTGQTSALLRYLDARHPRLSFALALGADLAPYAHSWQGWEEIVEDHTIEWIPRRGSSADAHAWKHLSTSCTEAGNQAAMSEPIADLLSQEVASYVQAHRLYRPRMRTDMLSSDWR